MTPKGLFSSAVLWISCLLCALSQDVPLEMFDSFEYGSLTAEHLHHLADNIHQGELSKELHWFANKAILFTFKYLDDVIHQGYYIPGDLYQKALNTQQIQPCEADGFCAAVDTVIKPVVFMAGWTESTVKYGNFLHELHDQGHDVFSFDLKGQGFSDSTKYTPEGFKISHVTEFSEFVDDLAHFMGVVMPEQLHKHTNNVYVGHRIVPSYIGFSLSGLIGTVRNSILPHAYSFINVVILYDKHACRW